MSRCILSFDVEFWYSPEYVSSYIKDDTLQDTYLTKTIKEILKILEAHNVEATFFILGEVVEKNAEVVEDIYESGHEIASHSYNHISLYKLSLKEVEDQLKKSKEKLRKFGKIYGFRAPNFSINNENKEVMSLIEKYFKYDSSIYPAKTPLYGEPKAPLVPYHPCYNDITMKGSMKIKEYPLTILDFGKIRIPACGGFYFRAYPIKLTELIIKNYLKKKRVPIIYLHPWELNRDIPKLKLNTFKKFITYYNIQNSIKKLKYLLKKFRFSPFYRDL